MAENENEYADLSEGVIKPEDIARQQLNEMIASKEFKALPIFEQIKKTMSKFGVDVRDPNPSCNSCYGRGYTGKKVKTGEPIPCSCIMPKMNLATEVAYDNRSALPSNRNQRRKMMKHMTQTQGNFTKKPTKGRVSYRND
tara:strand:- start:1861 stop:2280 length:420 start_codon:yes stop_codon:yes gene_type:complete